MLNVMDSKNLIASIQKILERSPSSTDFEIDATSDVIEFQEHAFRPQHKLNISGFVEILKLVDDTSVLGDVFLYLLECYESSRTSYRHNPNMYAIVTVSLHPL